MNRQEERQQAAIKEHPRFAERRIGFIAGAEWADANPDGKMLLHVCNKSAEQGKKQMLDNVCEWLEKNYMNYAHNTLGAEYLINDLRKAMEE